MQSFLLTTVNNAILEVQVKSANLHEMHHVNDMELCAYYNQLTYLLNPFYLIVYISFSYPNKTNSALSLISPIDISLRTQSK